MSRDMALDVRMRATDDGLVGQLNASERAVKAAKTALKEMADAARGASAATDASAASDRAAVAGARGIEAARKAQAAAAKAAARAEAQAADEIARAMSRHRAGMQNAGYQVQDFFVQVEGGTPIMRAFSQQASQLTGALAMMGGGADGTAGKFAKFANFLAGPWGVAIGVAIPLVSILTAKLFENGEASDEAEAAAEALSKRLGDMATFFDLATGAVIRNSEALIANARLQRLEQLDDLATKNRDRAKDIRNLVIGSTPGEVRFGGTFGNETGRATIVRSGPSELVSALEVAGRNEGKISEALLRISRGGGVDAGRATKLLEMRAAAADDAETVRRLSLEEASLRNKRLADELRTDRHSPRSRDVRGSGGSASSASARALANFGDSADEKIQRIADAYNPAPTGLDKAFADLRAIDKIVADLGQRKPPSFEKLISEAQDARTAVLAGIAEPIDTIQQRLIPLPEGVVKARAAIEELDGVIAVLSERKPPNWQELVERAEQLKAVAADSVNGPLNDMVRASREQREQQLLVLQGREHEAAVLGRIQQLTRGMAPLTAEQRREVEAMVAAEERINELMQKRQDILSIHMAAIGDLRGALEDLASGGSGKGFLSSMKSMVQQFSGRMLVESLFGDSLRALEKKARGQSPLDREIVALAAEVDGLEKQTARSGTAAKLLADALEQATGRINSQNGGTAGAKVAHNLGDGSVTNVVGGGADDGAATGGDIVVTATPSRSIGARMLGDLFDFVSEMARAVTDPITEVADKYLGTNFFRKLSPALASAFAGFLTAGPAGGLLGALKELPGIPDKLSAKFGTALEGAQTGTVIAGVGKMLGLKVSTTGSQVGGAIGSVIPGVGGIVGSVVGGLLGGLFKKAPRGAAVITSAEEGGYSVTGNKAGVRENLTVASSSVQDGLQSIAQMLDASLGAFKVSIGEYKGWYRVSASGSGAVGDKKYPKWAGSDLLYDGQDAAAAVQAALRNAIADGAVQGISGAMQRALQSSSNIDKAVQEALKVREVEDILAGLGGSLERQFKEFETQAKERVRIARQYGFDVVAIEAHNADARAKLVDDILSSRIGSLQQLLEDMKFGDLFEGSAADRRDKLLTEIASAKSEAEKGVDGAADRLAELTRRLVETSRDAYGTAGSEYASDRASAISTAEAIIAAENERIRAAQQATLDTSAALQTQNALTNEQNDILSEIRAMLRGLGLSVSGNVTLADLSGVARQVQL